MAGLGFKDFQVGEVLTSADVDGYLMQQSVMRFADSAARGSALGTAVGTGVALAEGMVSYLDDANTLELFDGTAWRGVGGFDSVATITATDVSWTVPTLASLVVRVTVVGGGGGGGAAGVAVNGSAGASSTFACSAGTATASGGAGGPYSAQSAAGANGTNYLASGNGGGGAHTGTSSGTDAGDGRGGAITVAYLDLTGVSTASVTIGAGGAGGSSGGDGGDGVVIVEYRAG